MYWMHVSRTQEFALEDQKAAAFGDVTKRYYRCAMLMAAAVAWYAVAIVMWCLLDEEWWLLGCLACAGGAVAALVAWYVHPYCLACAVLGLTCDANVPRRECWRANNHRMLRFKDPYLRGGVWRRNVAVAMAALLVVAVACLVGAALTLEDLAPIPWYSSVCGLLAPFLGYAQAIVVPPAFRWAFRDRG